jgi:hypothetical protein
MVSNTGDMKCVQQAATFFSNHRVHCTALPLPPLHINPELACTSMLTQKIYQHTGDTGGGEFCFPHSYLPITSNPLPPTPPGYNMNFIAQKNCGIPQHFQAIYPVMPWTPPKLSYSPSSHLIIIPIIHELPTDSTTQQKTTDQLMHLSEQIRDITWRKKSHTHEAEVLPHKKILSIQWQISYAKNVTHYVPSIPPPPPIHTHTHTHSTENYVK